MRKADHRGFAKEGREERDWKEVCEHEDQVTLAKAKAPEGTFTKAFIPPGRAAISLGV